MQAAQALVAEGYLLDEDDAVRDGALRDGQDRRAADRDGRGGSGGLARQSFFGERERGGPESDRRQGEDEVRQESAFHGTSSKADVALNAEGRSGPQGTDEREKRTVLGSGGGFNRVSDIRLPC
jgi:hypothetical protein